MAVAYQSHTAASIGSTATQVAVSHPSSLAAGDLMVAFISTLDGNATIDVISGWTAASIGETSTAASGTTLRTRILYKVATGTDVSNGSTTFTFAATSDFFGASIHRITGQNPVTAIDAVAAGSSENTANPSFATGITPTYASELYLFCVAGAAGGDGVSSQAFSVSNPSWTEDYDVRSTLLMSVAHATRTEVTGLGNASVHFDANSGSEDSTITIVVIKDLVNVTVTPAVINATGAVLTPTISGGATVAPSVINATGAVLSPAHNDQADWSAQDKSDTATWTNTSKS